MIAEPFVWQDFPMVLLLAAFWGPLLVFMYQAWKPGGKR